MPVEVSSTEVTCQSCWQKELVLQYQGRSMLVEKEMGLAPGLSVIFASHEGPSLREKWKKKGEGLPASSSLAFLLPLRAPGDKEWR